MGSNKKDRAVFDQPGNYVILVRGRLPERWQAWFEGMQIQAFDDDMGGKSTAISGPVKDQAALFGILERIRDLGLPLLGVHGEQDPPTSAAPQASVEERKDEE